MTAGDWTALGGSLLAGSVAFAALAVSYIRNALAADRERSDDTYARLDAVARIEVQLQYISQQIDRLLRQKEGN